ncbi:MAG: histidine triad nucleotide-binding protein [Clostridiales bacterium]|nr:histidine triad nucleotide-binding protein [Clostridiales bacterium]
MDCLFCKIVSGDIPSKKIYEDDLIYVFEDIAPTAPIHYLLIPKEHIVSAASINENNSKVIAHIFEIIAQLAEEKGMEEGFRVVNNCGESGGQTVMHLHFHLLSGRQLNWPAG